MTQDVSPWVKKFVRIYIIVVGAGILLGILSGGQGGIFVVPLLLPWIVIVPMIELKTGLNLLDSIWAGPLTSLVAGAMNAYILLLFLKFLDRRRRRKLDRQ